MKKIIPLRKLELVLILVFLCACKNEISWTPLLDNDLSAWDTYLSYRLPGDYSGEVPVDENGVTVDPIGLNNNVSNVFSVTDSAGSPVLKISGEIYGCVITKQEYENYHLKMKVKWGNKKWEPRLDKLLDSGILYHSRGEFGDGYWRTWMPGQEFQVMEGHMGDYWNFSTTGIDIRAFIPEGEMNSVASDKQSFVPLGAGSDLPGFCLRSADYESAMGEWTELELICFGDKSLHIVNGHVVMILMNSRSVNDGKSVPLTKGRIQLQSEAAEVYYKDIMIRTISEMPDKFENYFKPGLIKSAKKN